MIKVENLSKSFRTEEVETIALNGVSFEVKDGEFVAIMGPSGCGKSTLLNILGLLDNPTGGKYWLDGKAVDSLKEKDRTDVRKGQIGFVFQSFNLIDELNVEENIELPLTYLNIPAKERKQRVQEIMKRMRSDMQLVSGSQFMRDALNFRMIEIGHKPSRQPDTTIRFEIKPQPLFHKNFDLLKKSLEDYQLMGYKVYILADSRKQQEKLKEILGEPGGAFVDKTLHEGFVDNMLKACLFTDHQIFDRFHKYNLRSEKARSGKVALTLKEISQF